MKKKKRNNNKEKDDVVMVDTVAEAPKKKETRYRAAVANPRAWAIQTPFYQEDEGDVGPPLGDTGASLGVSYMGAPKIDSFHVKLFYATTAPSAKKHNNNNKLGKIVDNAWSARRFDFSIGKLLRLDMGIDRDDDDERRLIFCSFRKTLQAIRDGSLRVDRVVSRKDTEIREFGFGPYLDRRGAMNAGGANDNDTYSVVEALLVRLCAAHDRMWQLKTDTMECLRVQLFIDCMLDLSYYIQVTGRYTDREVEEEDPSALYLFYPHGWRFVHGGELPSMIPSMMFASLWHEIRPTTKDLVSMLIHLFGCKSAHHRCQIRNMVKILYDDTNPEHSDHKKTDGDPRVMGLVKDIIHVSLMGNFPHCRCRPNFAVRMHIRQSCLRFFRSPSRTSGAAAGQGETMKQNWQWGIWWFDENTYLLRACMKEYHLYGTRYQPAARSVLMASHNHAEHELFVFRSMDVARRMLESQGPGVFRGDDDGSRLCALMESIEKEHEHAHKNALKSLTKLRKGSFTTVVMNKIKTWLEGKEGVRAATKIMLSCVDRHTDTTDTTDTTDSVRKLRESLLKMLKTANPRVKEKPRVQQARRRIMAEITENLEGISAVCWEQQQQQQQNEEKKGAAEEDPPALNSPRGRLLFRYLAMGVYRDKGVLRWPVHRPEDEDDFVALLTQVASRASKNKRNWFEMDWLLLLGVSPEGVEHFRKLYYCYEMEDIPDNRISNEFSILFERNLRDLALIFVFLDKIVSIGRTETRSLDNRVMVNQVEAARDRYKIPSWCLTPADITTKRYCGGCGAWADVVVTPDSKPSSVYATGLRAASFDAVTGVLRCKKKMTPGCKEPLIEVDMKGKALLVSAVKRPPKWFCLCATCAALTVFETERIDYRGPNCGMHPVSVAPLDRDDPEERRRPLEIQDSNPQLPGYLRSLRHARVQRGLEEKHLDEEEYKCACCVTRSPLVNMHRVPVLDDRQGGPVYPRTEIILCRQDYNCIKRILSWTPQSIDGRNTAVAAANHKNKKKVPTRTRASRPRRSYVLYSQVVSLIETVRARFLLRHMKSGIVSRCLPGTVSIPEHKYYEKG